MHTTEHDDASERPDGEPSNGKEHAPSCSDVNEADEQAGFDWRSMHLWQIQPVRDVLVGLSIVGLFWLGQKISIVTVPLLLAILLAYLFEPVISWVMRTTRWTRQRAVTAVLAAAICVIILPTALGLTFGAAQSLGLIKRLANNISTTYGAVETGRQLHALETKVKTQDKTPHEETRTNNTDNDRQRAADSTPPTAASGQQETITDNPTQTQQDLMRQRDQLALQYTNKLNALEAQCGSAWRDIAEYLKGHADDTTINNAFDTIRDWLTANAKNLANAGAGALRSTVGFFGKLFGLAFMGFITAFFFYFIATGWVQFTGFAQRLIPEKHHDLILDLANKFDAVISGFIRGRLTIAFLQSIVFTIGYLLIGVPAAFVLGPAVAILSIVPYLALIGVPVSIVLLALEGHEGFRGSWAWTLLAPTAFYFIGQALDDYVWTPKIQGKSTDMSTPMILFASMAGGVLFGVFGLLIAIPLAACLKIVLQEIVWPRFQAWAEGRAEDFLPIGRD